MRLATWLLLASLGAAVAVDGAPAQSKPPARPNIGTHADTNDAHAYYTWAVDQLTKHPSDAADALYWATRIDPSWADAYYARWAALQLSDPHRLQLYLKGDEGTLRSQDIRRIDSLFLRALALDPFLSRPLESVLRTRGQDLSGTTATREKLGPVIYFGGQGGDPNNRPALNPLPERVSNGPVSTQYRTLEAWNAYSLGYYQLALREWAALLATAKNRSLIYAERGRIFWMTAAYDSAASQFAQAAAEWRAEDKDHAVLAYDSKALYEYSLGRVDEKMNRGDSARAAYARALDADPSFAVPHLRLSALHLAAGDTAAALGELDTAGQADATDEVIAYEYGSALLRAGHAPEAIEQLQRAVSLDPSYAAPRVMMAMVYDAADMKREAAQQFRAFIGLASEHEPLLERAKQRLAALDSIPAPAERTPPKP